MITPAAVTVKVYLDPQDKFEVLVEDKRYTVHSVTYAPDTGVMHAWGTADGAERAVSLRDDGLPQSIVEYLTGLVVTRSISV